MAFRVKSQTYSQTLQQTKNSEIITLKFSKQSVTTCNSTKVAKASFTNEGKIHIIAIPIICNK